MKRYYFSIYDCVAETYAEPFPIFADDLEKACKIAMRSVSNMDKDNSVIPIEDLQLYHVGFFENGAMVPVVDGNDCSNILVCNVSELFKKEVNNG